MNYPLVKKEYSIKTKKISTKIFRIFRCITNSFTIC